ncbi:hypothetical protein [Streptomyces sp. PTY087I2]|uniref:hypothetical protein n=1 Tax=Streptomyces sp. PTY087I2 TaxID=1819298 RepID=UPI0008287A14|nr:hypothetical protein [Streptomyces sp. PTY087I2]OCC13989.1 hypothetical protein A3Q37_00261 [Streptomyces sp. PTY087I2]
MGSPPFASWKPVMIVTEETASPLRRREITPLDEAKRRLAHVMYRSLLSEGIAYDLIVTIDEVLSDAPALGGRRLDDVLVRFGFPARRSRPLESAPLSREDALRVRARFQRATVLFMQIAPYRAPGYPTEELRLLRDLSNERADLDDARPYLRRYALVLSALLDLMGDDVE